MEKYKNYSITFSEEFFNSLSQRWLSNIEIFLLLNNIDELINNNIIKISSSKELNESTINSQIFKDNLNGKNENNFYILPYSEYGNIPKDIFIKPTYHNIKIKTIDKIKVINSFTVNAQRRIYFLLNKPKYIFVHYRYIKLYENNNHNIINKQFLEKININTTPINIINFNPDTIEEEKENQKLFIVIKSKFNFKELNYLIPFLSISFGNKFVKCEIVSDNVISCYIPPQKKKEVIIDIYFSSQNNGFMNKLSIYKQKDKKSFVYISKNNTELNKINKEINLFNSIGQKNCYGINTYKIFNYGIKEIINRVISLFNYFLSHINFYKDNNDIENNSNDNNFNKTQIDISLIYGESKIEGGGFYETNVNILLEKVINELRLINKIDLINYCDEDGYNLLHYLSVLNFSKSLILLNSNKLNFTEKSKDNLTAYEICAGKRNLDSLLTIIDIMENKDNEQEKNWYDLDIYKSALFLFLEKQKSDYDDVQILNALLKQIKIKYIIDSTSEKIIDNVNINSTNNIKNEELFYDVYTNRKLRKIQKAVKSWLKRNKYKSLHKSANTLIEKIKESCENMEFSKKKNTALFIQSKIRKWLKEKHKKKNKDKD